MIDSTIQAFRDHAMKEFGDGSDPKESCGLIVVRKGKEVYIPCNNVSPDPKNRFRIDPKDYADAEDSCEILAIVHSHVLIPPNPSLADQIGCEKSGIPWVIVNVPTGNYIEFSPSGFSAPLLGRTYHHGVTDCYSLVRDYYKSVLNIDLPDFDREYGWWEKGQNLYMDNYEKAGFSEVLGGLREMKTHDVLLMQISSSVVSHSSVYIGDNKIIQHCVGRLSSRDVLGESLRRTVIKVLRHKDLANA